MRSNCKGCYQMVARTILWVTEPRNWSEAAQYCQLKSGTLFGQFGSAIKALTKKFVEIDEPPFAYEYNTYILTGGYQDGDSLTWKSLETKQSVPYNDIFWYTGQPSNGNGHFAISINPFQFTIDPDRFIHDTKLFYVQNFVCSIPKI